MKASRILAAMILVYAITAGCGGGSADDDPENTLLLSQWNPVSQFKLPVTTVDRARFPVTDVHCHDYGETPEGVAEWAGTMEAANIEKTVVLTQATGAKLDSLVEMYAVYPEKFLVWCGFDYSGYGQPGWGEQAAAELERCAAAGAKGVGELGDKGSGMWGAGFASVEGLHPDDPKMDPLFEKCAELGLPVSLHVADPIWMYAQMDGTNEGLWEAFRWRMDNKSGIVGHDGMLDILDNVCKRHPNTTFVTCHNGNLSHDLDRLGKLFDSNPNLYADISARFGPLAATPRQSKRYLTRYQDRFVYGTDMGRTIELYRSTFHILESDDEHFWEVGRYNYYWALSGLDLSEDVLKKIYRDNSRKILMF
jgi:predicted TIM-barrel fold metal-dependent hydrolase